MAALADHYPSPHVTGRDTCGGIEAAFDGDQCFGHCPVEFVPGGGDLRCHGLTEHLEDRFEQILVHDLVLIGGHPQRCVFVRDPGQQRPQSLRIGIQLQGRETGDGRGQCALLVALLLVAAVEQVPLQLGMSGEHLLVEQRRDLADGRADSGQRCTDNLPGSLRQHVHSPIGFADFCGLPSTWGSVSSTVLVGSRMRSEIVTSSRES